MDSDFWVEGDYDRNAQPNSSYDGSYNCGNIRETGSFSHERKRVDDYEEGHQTRVVYGRRGRGRGMGNWQDKNVNDYSDGNNSKWVDDSSEHKNTGDSVISERRGYGRGRNSSNMISNQNDHDNEDGWGSFKSENTYRADRFDDVSDRHGRGRRFEGRGDGRGRKFEGRGRTFEGRDRDQEGGNMRMDSNDDGFRNSGGMERGRREGPFSSGGGNEQEEEKPKERYIPPEPTNDENVIFGTSISSGINFDKYDSIQVKVTGNNVIKAISSFEECKLEPILMDNIIKSAYIKPTPVQKHALPIICCGRDLMACAQTGSGKTAAFLIPIINSLLISSADGRPGRTVEPQVVICSPTRELAIQIYNEARKFSHGSFLKICIAYGGTVVSHQSRNISRGCNILVATPGRLNDFVNRNVIRFSQVKFLVLDEADLMLDMGFMPAIEQIITHSSMTQIGERQTIMLSATFPEAIQRLASNYLDNYLFLAVGIVGGACSDVEQVFYEVRKFNKRQKLVDILTDNSSSESCLTLIFVEKKRTADFIAAFLSENNFPATSIHGDRLQSQREEALRHFKSGQMPILVATAVAARGLDIKNVSHVLNYDLPNSVEEYVHRIGRTGRVGNRGLATSFYDPNENEGLAENLVRILEQSGQDIPSFFESIIANKEVRNNYDENEQAFGGMDVRRMVPPSFAGDRSGLEEEELWET